ncbi:hypothetical protein [uncultured Selenomonas sp.]|uniref:hypothetical protein n=1 Tax=uncultured Selenomonas sp. TaxID=159275 RepID=UPI0028E423D8|nr:hypothetical protein [uncultured Selenomonas sp.]
MTGLKDRQRLALYVALGLSAGSGLMLDASTAYANPDNHVTVLSTDPDFSTKYASGVNATNETHSVKDNVVTIGRKSPVDTPAINGDVVGGYSNAYAVTHNTVTVDDMTLALAKSVFGGLADGDKAADDNEVTINGGTFAGSNAVYGGKSDTGTATNNTVTIAGGTFSNANVAGGAASTGTTSNHNRVVLGSDHGVYTADLSQADIWGTRYSGDAVVASGNAAITGNTLTVNAQNVTVNKVRNFEKYQFNLNEGVARNASMLTVNDTDGFGTGANVQWDDIRLNANGWNGDTTNPDNTTTHNGKVGTVRLLQSGDNNRNFTIHSTAPLVRNGVSGDFEYMLSTDGTFSGGATQVSHIDASVNRIRNANTSYNGTTGAAGGEVYAGISELGNTAYNNRMTVTGVPNGGLPAVGLGAAYGGKVTGASGNAYANALTITGTNEPNAPHAAQSITNAYGGAITNAANAGAVGDQTGNANRITVTGGVVTNAYGGYSAGTGTVSGNTARIAGGRADYAYGGAGAGDVRGNVAVLDGGSVGDIFGAASRGGDAANNHVIIRSGTVMVNIRGGQTTNSGNASGNDVIITGGTINGNVAAGGSVSGNVSGNHVAITGGTINGNVAAGDSTSGNVTGNTISLGDETVHNLSTAALGGANLYGANTTGVASGNTLAVNAVAAKVSSVNAFNGYNFNIGDYVRTGDTMLSVANAGAFDTAASGVDWAAINVNNVQKLGRLSDVQGVERVTLLQGNTALGTPQLKLNNYASREVVSSSTHEVTLRTDNDTSMANAVVLDYNRYRDGRVVHNLATPSTVVTLSDGSKELYGGVSHYANHPTVNNDLEIQNLAASITAAYGGKNESTAGVVTGNRITVTNTGGHAIDKIYGGAVTNTGSTSAVGGTAANEANSVMLKAGQFGDVYGGYTAGSGAVQNNNITIAGGTVGTAAANGSIYANYSATGAVHGGTVTIDEDAGGVYSADLTHANLYGDNAAAPTDNDNTLNVRAHGVTVKTVNNFDNYKFDLRGESLGNTPMLNITQNGFGKEIDWNKVTVDNVPDLRGGGNPGGRVTLIEGNTPNALAFTAASYNGARNLGTVDADTEFALSTDTGNRQAKQVLLTYAKFRNNTWTYDGTTPSSTANEVYGGLSYLAGDTTENNALTVTGVPHGGLAAAYGGKTYGDADSKNNVVLVQGTAEHIPSVPTAHDLIGKVYGGYTQAANRTAEGNNVILAKGNVADLYGGMAEGERGTAKNNTVVLTQEAAGVVGRVTQNTYGGAATGAGGTAAGNRVIITAGTAHDVYGGMVSGGVSAGTSNKVSTADGNIVQMIGGSAANVYGGDALNATDGTASGNNVFVTGGTVNGNIAGARAKYNATNAPSKGNTVTFGAEDGNHRPLGATFAAGTTVYGTNYQDASGDVTFDGNDAAVKGNTLNVNAKDVTVGTVRNFEKFNFNLGDTAKDGDVMLSLTQAGGFGTTSGSPSAPVQVDWTKVKADTSHLSTVRGQGAHGKNTITLVRETASTAASDLLNFANYTVAAADYSGTDRDYETKMHTDNNAASTESVVLELNRFRNDSVLHDGTTQPDAVYGGYSAYDDTAVDANGDHLGHTTENNMLGITGVASGTNNLKAYGGYAGGDHGGAVNNHVNVNIQNTTPGVLDSVYGGYASGAHAGVVRGNTATLDSGIIADILAGGYADSTGADHNEVHINGGTVGTYIDPSTGSTVTHAAKVYGGYGTTATDNTVEILAGTLTGNVYGGYATTAGTPATTATTGASPTAEVSALRNNKVTLRDGVTVTGNVYGAYAAADASNMTAATDSNTIDLYKAVIDGTLYGGMARDATGNDVVSGKNNTLAVHARGAKADDFVGVQNLHFYVPAGTTAADQETMLTLDNVAAPAAGAPTTKDLSHVNVGVKLAGNRPSLKVGDAVSLMKVYEGNTIDATHAVAITSDTPLVNKTTGMQGVSLRYNFDLLTREAEAGSGKNNELYATVTSASVNPDTKSLVETRAASLAFLTSGSDLLTDAAMTAAMEVAATPASESQAGRARVDGAPKEYRMWAVQNVSSMRLNSGSHVDAKGWGLNLGFAKQRVAGRNTLTYGPFVEYGKGSYDSYLDDGLHGSGNMDYLGVGVMAKSQSENGAYVEGSVRVGRVKSDYAGTIDNTHTTYDSSSTYYAGHLGVGQEKQLKNGNTIETYAKYFFTHQGGDTAKLSTGEVYDFDAADSHRIRFGTRYTSKKGDASFYTGLAYEYEFGNDIAASFEGYHTPSPSLTGGTGILELGYRFTPQNGRATYGIQLMGMTGKRRGISGGVQMHWAF